MQTYVLETTTAPKLHTFTTFHLFCKIVFYFLVYFPFPGCCSTFKCTIYVHSHMAKDYRDDSLEEAEPLAGDNGAIRTAWKSEKVYTGSRLQNWKHRWVWLAHAVLLSISMSSLALSLYIRPSTKSALIPVTYCSSNHVFNESCTKLSVQCLLKKQ